MTMTSIRKRDGRVAPFDEEKIAGAIGKAFDATYKPGYGETAHKLADEVVSILELEGDRLRVHVRLDWNGEALSTSVTV